MKGGTKRAIWIIVSVAFALFMPADRYYKARPTGRMHSETFSRPKTYGDHEIRELFNVHSPRGLKLERDPSCADIQLLLRTKLEEYKERLGFYPKEEGWVAELLRDAILWPYHPALKQCPKAPPDENLYEYRADSVPGSTAIENRYGTGYSKYELGCTNPECPEYKE